MANATRLRIVHQLRQQPSCVSEIAQATNLAQAKVSQHLGILRARGIVATERRGSEIIYRIANPKIVRVCDLMREVLADQAAERSNLIETLRSAR